MYCADAASAYLLDGVGLTPSTVRRLTPSTRDCIRN